MLKDVRVIIGTSNHKTDYLCELRIQDTGKSSIKKS